MNESVRRLLDQNSGSEPAAKADAAPAQRPSPNQDAAANAIARQTMSPFCPGRTLADCPSEYAAEWRRDIRHMLAEGRKPAEIQDELERRAGANLSGSPARDTSYWVPAAFALFGVAVLSAIFVRLRRPATPSEGSTPGASKTETDANPQTIDDARLESELAAEGDDDR